MQSTFYLTGDKSLALADLMLGCGLEPSFDQMPDIHQTEFLPDTMPRNAVAARYYKDGGNEWPDRWLIEHSGKIGNASFMKARKAA